MGIFIKNPSDLLKRVRKFYVLLHIIIISPECQYENDDDVDY